MFICLASLCSIWYLVSQLYQSFWVGLPIAIFFSWMITNMYILLLYTLTRNPFPSKVKPTAQIFSVTIRFAFITMLALLISKPLEVWLLKSDLDVDVNAHKAELFQEFIVKTDSLFDSEIQFIEELLAIEKRQNSSSTLTPQRDLEKELNQVRARKSEIIKAMEKRIAASSFFLYRLTLVITDYRKIWLMTFIVIIVFWSPAIIKYLLPKDSEYNTTKKKWEVEFVQLEYKSFVIKYNLINELAHHPAEKWIEHYQDAPFNTIRIQNTNNYEEEKELIDWIYNELDRQDTI